MVNAPITSREIQQELKQIVERNNEKIKTINALPKEIAEQFDTQIFDDIDYLLRYITALHNVLSEVADEKQEGNTFDF